MRVFVTGATGALGQHLVPAQAEKELGWEPRYASWREGFGAWVSG
jgi:uncharacterized protein YbjT (DUF2867 family)